MSSIVDELAQLSAPKTPIQCRTCKAILIEPRLDESIRAAQANGATQDAISAVLKRHGYDVSVGSLQKHLKNGHKPL